MSLRRTALFTLLALLGTSPVHAARRERADARPDRVAKPSRGPTDAEHPGRLLNEAQQQLARGEVEAALGTLRRSLQGAPEDGYAWSLLADVLVWGLAQGPETAAAWKAAAAAKPEEPLLAVWAIRAEQSTHRGDRFSGSDTPWVQEARRVLDGLAADGQPLNVRYAALIARRDLRSFSGDGAGARDDGAAAWNLDKKPLQGRISRLQRAAAEFELPLAKDLCLEILATDPWAAEACSVLWGPGAWPDATAIAEARTAVQEAVLRLGDRGVSDPVVGNELVKFWKRVRDAQHQSDLVHRIEGKHKGWKLLESDDWWKGMQLSVNPKFQQLFAGTNRTYAIEDPAARLAALLALSAQVPAGSADPVVVRYHQAVIAAARLQSPPDRANRAGAIDALIAATPEDPLPWFERATLLWEEGKDLPLALEAVRKSEGFLLSRRHELRTTNGPVGFAWSQERLSKSLGERRALAGRIEEAMGRTTEALREAREAALLADDAQSWVAAATLAARTGDVALAREADITAYARASQDPSVLSDEFRAAAAARWEDAHPEARLMGQGGEDALLAAAKARGADTKVAPTPTGKPKETHPFVGKPAPAIQVKTMDGTAVSLASLAGNVVVLDFWATWCGPCKQEMPELEAVKGRLGDAKVVFLMLSIDHDAAAVPKFLAENPYTFQVAHIGDGPTKSAWRVKGIPSLFLIDGQGVVRHHQQGFRAGLGTEIEAKIRGLL